MLDQKDIELLQGVMESAVDKRLTETETSILNKMDEKLTETENLILEEMDRTRKILEDKIAQVQKNVDELNSYYRITRLEHDNTTLLLKMIDELSKRVDELEKRSA